MFHYLPYIFGHLTEPLSIAFIVFGNIIGMIFGAIPGLSGAIAIVLFMPMTYPMSPESGLILLLSLYVGGVTGGFIGSVLLGIPGAPSSVATTFDGYPMTQKGQAGKALAIGMTASFMGTFFSAIAAAILSEYVADLAFMMGPWEYFSLCFMAITMVIAISKDNIFKGLAAASLGLLLGSVGMSPVDAYSRFTYNVSYLLGGIDMTIVLLGTFAVAMIATKYAKGFDPPYEVNTKNIKGFGVSLKEIKEQTVNIIRSYGIGLGIGFLPGLGPALSNLVAYASTKKRFQTPRDFRQRQSCGCMGVGSIKQRGYRRRTHSHDRPGYPRRRLNRFADRRTYRTRDRNGSHGLPQQWKPGVSGIYYCGHLFINVLSAAENGNEDIPVCTEDTVPLSVHGSAHYLHMRRVYNLLQRLQLLGGSLLWRNRYRYDNGRFTHVASDIGVCTQSDDRVKHAEGLPVWRRSCQVHYKAHIRRAAPSDLHLPVLTAV